MVTDTGYTPWEPTCPRSPCAYDMADGRFAAVDASEVGYRLALAGSTVLVGAPGFQTGYGTYLLPRVYGVTGDLQEQGVTWATDYQDACGTTLAVGQPDGTGRAPIAIGAPGEESADYSGVAYLLSDWPTGDVDLRVAAALRYEGDKWANTAVGLGFWDLEGAGEVRWVASGFGAAHAYAPGSIVLLDPALTGVIHSTDADRILTGDPGFGARVVGWDGDGDGIVDLVTTDGDDVVRFASPLDAVGPDQAETRWTTSGPEPDFYPVAGLGDLTGDGLPDLGLGDHTFQSTVDRGGAAYVIAGGDLASTDTSLIPLQWQGTVVGEGWGASLAGGDIDGDGQLDLVVGAQGLIPGDHPGQVAGYLGPITSLDPADAAFVVYGTEKWSYFGTSTLVADPDGDGETDVYVGASNEAYGTGAVYWFTASALLAL